MIVYDFDETVYFGDSEFHFIEYVFAKYPKMKKYSRRYKFYRFLQKKLKLVSRDYARQKIFSFLKEIPDIDGELEVFWAKHEKNLKKWYLAQKRADDVILSATPEFILKPITEIPPKTFLTRIKSITPLSGASFLPLNITTSSIQSGRR